MSSRRGSSAGSTIPYSSALPTTSTAGASPRRRTASSRWTIPSTFVRSVPPGSIQDRWTLDCPARWTMRSGATASSTGSRDAGSFRSASSTVTAPPAGLWAVPGGRTRPNSSASGCSARRKSTRWPATNPPAPVTSTFTGIPEAAPPAQGVLAHEVADRAHVGQLDAEAELPLVASVVVVADSLHHEAAALHVVAEAALHVPEDLVHEVVVHRAVQGQLVGDQLEGGSPVERVRGHCPVLGFLREAHRARPAPRDVEARAPDGAGEALARSEEHTSELQS